MLVAKKLDKRIQVQAVFENLCCYMLCNWNTFMEMIVKIAIIVRQNKSLKKRFASECTNTFKSPIEETTTRRQSKKFIKKKTNKGTYL